MFDNIGGKIKALATTITVLGMIASIICGTGIIMEDYEQLALGILIILGGSLVSWISTFILYGFGELISHLQHLRYHMADLSKRVSKISAILDSQFADWTCGKCGKQNESTAQHCKDCGAYR